MNWTSRKVMSLKLSSFFNGGLDIFSIWFVFFNAIKSACRSETAWRLKRKVRRLLEILLAEGISRSDANANIPSVGTKAWRFWPNWRVPITKATTKTTSKNSIKKRGADLTNPALTAFSANSRAPECTLWWKCWSLPMIRISFKPSIPSWRPCTILIEASLVFFP